MPGRTVATVVRIAQGLADGSEGGGSLVVNREQNYPQAAGEVGLTLTDAVTPVTIPVPAGGARVVGIRVVDKGTTLPTLILVGGAGTASLQFDGSFHIESSPTGPAYTSVAIKGVCEIAYLVAGG
jgi:hypothetical protein